MTNQAHGPDFRLPETAGQVFCLMESAQRWCTTPIEVSDAEQTGQPIVLNKLSVELGLETELVSSGLP